MDAFYESFPDSTRGDSSKIDSKNIVENLSESMREQANNLDIFSILSNSPDFDDVIDIEIVGKKRKPFRKNKLLRGQIDMLLMTSRNLPIPYLKESCYADQ